MTSPPAGDNYPPAYPAPPRATNGTAIAALVGSLLFAPLGIVLGHIALSQIKKTGEGGKGMALAGLIIGYVLTLVALLIVVIVVAVGVFWFAAKEEPETKSPDLYIAESSSTITPPPVISPPPVNGLPPFDPPTGLGSNCTYPATGALPSRPNTPPRPGAVPTQPEIVDATLTTNFGNVGLSLDNGKAPCTVNSFVSLAQQGYFDDTSCHRLTTGELSVLQCGDPSGTGGGSPGYRFDDEYPVNQQSSAGSREGIIYPRGTLAMANAGPGTNGSQFFIVYQDSALPPAYTVFGTVDAGAGMDTIDRIAQTGIAGGADDGRPATDIVIESIRLD